MNELKERVEFLLEQGRLKKRAVGMVSIYGDYYEAAKILCNRGILPTAILSESDVDANRNNMGILCCSLKRFATEYSDNAVILINGFDYWVMRKELKKYGFIINQNVFVDFEVKSIKYIFKLNYNEYINRIKDKTQHMIAKSRGLLTYVRCICDQYRGYRIYRKIRQAEEDERLPIYVYNYSGMGDVFVFCLYLKANLHQISDSGIILTVIGGVSKRITDMFELKHVVKLTKTESKYLTHFARFAGDVYDIHPMTPFPSFMHTDIYSHFMYGKRMNMAEAYKYVLLNLKKPMLDFPKTACTEMEIRALFEHNKLQWNNTIVISPYANTILGYSLEFWEKLAGRLKKLGFCVCTNCAGKEPPIKGTNAFSFKIEMAEKVIEYGGYFLGLRSGFCDVICNSTAFKCIIYPDYPIFNANVYEFCSFAKMGFGQNIKEVCWGYSDMDLLTRIIIAAFKHAKYARDISSISVQNSQVNKVV